MTERERERNEREGLKVVSDREWASENQRRWLQLVADVEIKTSLLVVKREVNDEVILIFKPRDHVRTEMYKESFPCLLEDIVDHLRMYIIGLVDR